MTWYSLMYANRRVVADSFSGREEIWEQKMSVLDVL